MQNSIHEQLYLHAFCVLMKWSKTDRTLLFDLQDTTASNVSEISNKYNRTWTSYSKSKGEC